MSNNTIKTLRYMAWNRAKGELLSILETYWDEKDKYEMADKTIKEFITRIEYTGMLD